MNSKIESILLALVFLVPACRAAMHPGNELRPTPEFTNGTTLTAANGTIAVWPGFPASVLMVNNSLPAPTIRVRRGDTFSASVSNKLNEPLVLHWHGILAPSAMDGLPQSAVPPDQGYRVSFPILNRAGTYFYHAHTDGLTAKQVYRGLAGLFIVEDPQEGALGLPKGSHDIPMLIADKRLNPRRELTYNPNMMDMMMGFLGDAALVNGTPEAWLSVDRSSYRLRWVNGSNARILKLGFNDGRSFQVIGTDGGLLAAPVAVTNLTLAPGERADVVVDFTRDAVGTGLTLRSVPFEPGGMRMGGGMGMMGMGMGPSQGSSLDVMRFYVDKPNTVPGKVPGKLSSILAYNESKAARTRTFDITMERMAHFINGAQFKMDVTNFTVAWNQLERWEFKNRSMLPHPMHPHGTLFQVLSRSTGMLTPTDGGWKDTVLVNPNETVAVLVRFDAHAGRFIKHCHNLEHEDAGMMLNFNVESPPSQR
ncbi:MAG: multicopper oxidase domain-containing protein [Limisphaerales bacterium]